MNTLRQQIESELEPIFDDGFDYKGEPLSELDRVSTVLALIAIVKQREREAVEGFVDSLFKVKNTPNEGIYHINLMNKAETYLKEREQEDE